MPDARPLLLSVTTRALAPLLCAALAHGALSAPASAAAPAASEDGQWSMPAKDYAASRYSALATINAGNANALHPVWTFSTGVLGGHEGQPLVVGDTMYVVTPWPNVLYAFDLSKEGYPLRWKYRPEVSPNAIGVSCCDTVNRGAFYADGKMIYNLLDGHTVAVDAKSGRELWKTQVADVADGETVTMAPLVVKDRVIVGASGGEFGIYGWLKGLDLASGRIVWTARNIGPDAGMLAQPGQFKPPYDGGVDVGASSWAEASWKTGGAPVWGWISYDPELDLIFYGSGNASPYNAEQRLGDNKWTNSVLARRPADGALVWAYQFTPHDNWDYDATGAMVLADLTIAGKPTKVLVHFDKNGFAYTLDRQTGQLLSATAFVPVNWAKSVDLDDRPPGARSGQADRGLQGERQGHLPEPGRRRQPVFPAGVLPAHAPLLYLDEQHLHGLRRLAHHPLEGHAVHGREQSVRGRPGRLPRYLHGLGCGHRQEGLGEQGAVSQLERCPGDRR